jgi:hypothetical protein
MKVIWEIRDIVPGQRFGSEGCSEQWIIGYDPVRGNKAIVSLADGMISTAGTDAQIVEFLNKGTAVKPIELLLRPHRGPN